MLTPAQRRFAEAALGTIARVEACGRRTSRLHLADGARVYATVVGGDKHRREVEAYRAWAPAMAAATPTVLAASEPLQVILLSEVPGAPRRALGPDALEAAGRALASLHAAPVDAADPLPVAEALRRRARAVEREAAGAPVDLAAAAATLEAHASLAGPRVPCHRDFMPYNWLWTEAGGLGVVDFEHARPDVALADVARLAPGLLDAADGQGWAAFWRGYGRAPTTDEVRLLGALAALDRARTWAWAQRHPTADDARRIAAWSGADPGAGARAVARLLAGDLSSRRRG